MPFSVIKNVPKQKNIRRFLSYFGKITEMSQWKNKPRFQFTAWLIENMWLEVNLRI